MKFIILYNGKIRSYCDDIDSARNTVQELADFFESEMKNPDNIITRKITNSEASATEDYSISIYEHSIGYLYNSKPELKHTISFQKCDREIKDTVEQNKPECFICNKNDHWARDCPTLPNDKFLYVLSVYDNFAMQSCEDVEIYYNEQEAKKRAELMKNENNDLVPRVMAIKLGSHVYDPY